MSTPDDPAIAAFLVQLNGFIISNRSVFAAATLWVYEYTITMDQEIGLFWKRKLSGATALFFTNRYLVLLITIYGLVEYIPMSDKFSFERSCDLATKAYVGFTVWQYLPWALLSALRTFALNRNLVLSVIVFLLSVVTIGTNMAQFGNGLSGVNIPFFGCQVALDGVSTTRSQLSVLYVQTAVLFVTDTNLKIIPSDTIVSRGSLVVADTILLWATWSARDRMSIASSAHNQFSRVLFREGMLYVLYVFIVASPDLAAQGPLRAILTLNILQLILLLCLNNIDTPDTIDLDYVTVFTEPLTAIVVSRFLLDLQTANRDACALDSEGDSVGSESLVFQRVVGSIGASLGASTPSSGVDQDLEDNVESHEDAEAASYDRPEVLT
ncbi:hypothetical protein C8Q80DRAFT_1275643 [Daedaleopsis nitida]|nr:hypothetical protein C8Q80DRAFT_1275643 [Daedaleopsis nitida]